MDVDCILLELVQHDITTIFVLVRLQSTADVATAWASRNRRLCSHLRRTVCLRRLPEDAGISWRAYAEPDFGSPVFDNCPLDFNFLDVEHLAFVYFNDVNDGLNPQSTECIKHVRPYYQLATDLVDHTSARYNFITPNLCHDGHEDVSSCDATEPADNTLRSDTCLKQNVPLILESDEYKQGGALFIIWDEAEDDGQFRDGPIGMFELSPFAKGGRKRALQQFHLLRP